MKVLQFEQPKAKINPVQHNNTFLFPKTNFKASLNENS